MKEYTTHEVLAILKKYYISESPQVVSKWIREGKIHGVRSENRKEGYKVFEKDLFDFIEEQKPGLPAIMGIYEDHINQINTDKKNESIFNYTDKNSSEDDKADSDIHKEAFNLLEHKVNEIIEQNNILINEIKSLTEENQVLVGLYNILNEEIIELKRNRVKINKTSEKQEEDNQHKLSFKDFSELSMKCIQDNKINVDVSEQTLKEIYNTLCRTRNLVRKTLIKKDGSIECPYSKKTYSTISEVIESAVKCKFQQRSMDDD